MWGGGLQRTHHHTQRALAWDRQRQSNHCIHPLGRLPSAAPTLLVLLLRPCCWTWRKLVVYRCTFLTQMPLSWSPTGPAQCSGSTVQQAPLLPPRLPALAPGSRETWTRSGRGGRLDRQLQFQREYSWLVDWTAKVYEARWSVPYALGQQPSENAVVCPF